MIDLIHAIIFSVTVIVIIKAITDFIVNNID